MKKTLLLVTVILMLAVAFAGCAAKSADMAYDMADSTAAEAPMEEPAAMEEADAAEYESGSTSSKDAGLLGDTNNATYVKNDRKLIYRANFMIETTEYVSDYDKVMAAMEKAGGHISSRNSSGQEPVEYGDSGRYAYFSLRIPIDSYNSFIDDLGGVGEMTRMEESTEDVTASYYDNEARIELYTAHYNKLMGYLDKATTMEDVMAIESQITDVLYTLDSLKGDQRYLDDLVEYSTVDVELREVVEITKVVTSKDTLGSRIADSFNSVIKWLGRFFAGFAVVFISALPILAILTAIFLAIFLPLRAKKKKREKRAAQLAAQAGMPAEQAENKNADLYSDKK